MSNNYCGPLVDRRAMAPPSCMQYGVPPPRGYHHHPPPETLANIPFLFYPTNFDPTYYEAYGGMFPYAPFHGHFGIYDSPFEPAFIQKRNERERQRVKCVNEGYARLRGHLPGTMSEKRLSKVETLRAAIKYIQYLQDLLSSSPEAEEHCSPKGAALPRFPAEVTTDCKRFPAEVIMDCKRFPAEATTDCKRFPAEATTDSKRFPAEATTDCKRFPAEATTDCKRFPAEVTMDCKSDGESKRSRTSSASSPSSDCESDESIHLSSL